ncbi:RHS repeat-associated core domain-containing protein [Paenibacillus sp. FA6]|uniref:RHS repeat-associated core domain-containing protein n=1 Tax=Paenibacillus sp. FA6 TaxID=3413029 RepID=UPI003F654F6E
MRPLYPDQLATSYSYDAVNRLDQIIYGDGQQVSYSYDLAGRRTLMKDSSGDTRYTFDALNRLTEVIDGNDKNIRYEWTATGDRSRIIYPDNTVVSYSYDKSGQIEEVTDGTGLKTNYTYDANGRLASKSLPNNTQSTYNYDAVGQVLEIQHQGPGSTLLEQLKYTYDPAGNQLHSERQSGGSDEDNPTGATQPAEIVDYMYDALDQLTQVQKLNSATTNYSYDAVGNRLSVAVNDAGILSTEDYTYDAANKLMSWSKGSDYRDYTYDLRGNLLDVVGIDSVAAMNSLRMGITSTMSNAINSGVLDSVYGLEIDPNVGIDPNATGIVDPNASIGGVIDPGVVDPLTGLSVTANVYGIDPTALDSLDTLNSLMSMALSGPQTIESNRWDGANRLIGNTNYSGDQTSYGYDGDSNRVSMSITLGTGMKQSNYPSSNPAGLRDGWEPQYKKQQMDIYFTNDITLSLPEPLMATDASGNKWKQSYVYGAGGERISMSYLPSADASTDWEPSPGASGAAGNTTPKTLYYMSDVRGSAIGLLGADGSVSARYHYDEFGVAKDPEKFDLNWAGPDNMFGYTGLGYDFNSGHSYARARYLDSEVGRFISEDTYEGDIKNPQALNLYTYVANNPLRYVDPSGHYYEFKTSDYLELNILLDDARKLSKSSRTNKYYQLHKDTIRDRYDFKSVMGENRYNYLFDLITGTSIYGNIAGKSDWAKAQLLGDFQKSKEAEYIALLGMGMAGGIGGKRSVGNKSSKGTGNSIASSSINKLPSNVQNSYNQYSKNGWNGNVAGQTTGTKAGGTYQNSNGKLPATDSSGKPITYKEFDVNNKTGASRDAERFVKGSDGSIYYTDSHYGDIKSPTELPEFIRVN